MIGRSDGQSVGKTEEGRGRDRGVKESMDRKEKNEADIRSWRGRSR